MNTDEITVLKHLLAGHPLRYAAQGAGIPLGQAEGFAARAGHPDPLAMHARLDELLATESSTAARIPQRQHDPEEGHTP